MFTKPFDKYACIGDTVSCEVGKFTVTASLVYDYDSKPEDCDYTPEQIASFYREDWGYCGVVLQVSCKNVVLDNNAASLWAVEYNFPNTDNSYLLEVANELLPEALEQGAKILQTLKDV